MAVTVAVVRQQLASLAHFGGSHKDQVERYIKFIINIYLIYCYTFFNG